MAWDEWERLKAAAAAESGSARMRLNQVASEPGDGSGGADSGQLRTQKQAWSRTGQAVKRLREDVGKGLTGLEAGQVGLDAVTGCQSAAAQKDLHTSWVDYLGKLQRRCGDLGALLEQAGHDLSMTDAAIASQMERIAAGYADTDAVGGKAGAR